MNNNNTESLWWWGGWVGGWHQLPISSSLGLDQKVQIAGSVLTNTSYIGLHSFALPIFSAKEKYIQIQFRLVLCNNLSFKKNKKCIMLGQFCTRASWKLHLELLFQSSIFVHSIFSKNEKYIKIQSRQVLCNNWTTKKNKKSIFLGHFCTRASWKVPLELLYCSSLFCSQYFFTKEKHIKIESRLVLFNHLTNKKKNEWGLSCAKLSKY